MTVCNELRSMFSSILYAKGPLKKKKKIPYNYFFLNWKDLVLACRDEGTTKIIV